jgi:hypothetical protein
MNIKDKILNLPKFSRREILSRLLIIVGLFLFSSYSSAQEASRVVKSYEESLDLLKDKTEHKHIFKYDVIALTARKKLLLQNCKSSEDVEVPLYLNEYQQFIARKELDKGSTFSFLRHYGEGFSLEVYHCDNASKKEEIKSSFYDCIVENNTSKCFFLTLINLDENTTKSLIAIKKSALKQICVNNNFECDFTIDLGIINNPKNVLTKMEHVLITEIVAKLKKLKIKEKKIEVLAQQKAKKKEQAISACNNGDAKVCWKLYLANIGGLSDLANSYASRACELGNKNACKIVEGQRKKEQLITSPVEPPIEIIESTP